MIEICDVQYVKEERVELNFLVTVITNLRLPNDL